MVNGSQLNERHLHITFPLRGADGLFRPFLNRVQPVRDASGRVARCFGVNTDVSNQAAFETELTRKSEHLEVLNSTGGMIAAELNLDRLVQTVRIVGASARPGTHIRLKRSICPTAPPASNAASSAPRNAASAGPTAAPPSPARRGRQYRCRSSRARNARRLHHPGHKHRFYGEP